jgi:predicted nucleic acid-binding Zn finger protein
MTAKEIAKRNKKAEQLRVLHTDDNQFFVESGEGKILYNVSLDDDKNSCTCGDFAINSKKDPNFNCKHIMSVMNCIPTGEVENGKFLEKLVPKLDDRFLTNIKGKDFVLYAGVLDLANQKGLLKLEVELIQFPTKENGNEAICHAVAVGKNGEVFADIGDANPNNCHSMIAKHLIRMASTRSKARCLRDMCNIGIACLEELADFDDVIGSGHPKKATQKKAVGKTDKEGPKAKTAAKKKPPAKASKADKPAPKATKEQPKVSEKVEATDESNNDHPKMSSAQKNAIYNLSRRRGISVEELESMALETYGYEMENLNTTDASQFIRQLQSAA